MSTLPVLSCDDCGACCRHMGGTPTLLASAYASPDEAARLPAALRSELLTLVARWQANPGTWPGESAACIWYDAATRRCRHYEARPDVCREFEVGCLDCLAHRQRRGVGA